MRTFYFCFLLMCRKIQYLADYLFNNFYVYLLANWTNINTHKDLLYKVNSGVIDIVDIETITYPNLTSKSQGKYCVECECILEKSLAINNGKDSTQCKNSATQEISNNKFISLEPQVKLQRFADKDIADWKNRRVLSSIENFNLKCKFHNL